MENKNQTTKTASLKEVQDYLGLSNSEAARILGGGVNLETWKKWKSGHSITPPDVSLIILSIIKSVEVRQEFYKKSLDANPNSIIILVDYPSLRLWNWNQNPKTDEVEMLIYQRSAELAMEQEPDRIFLTSFNSTNYEEFLKNKGLDLEQDSPAHRTEWAVAQHRQ